MPQERRRPERDETAPYYYKYIDRIASDDVLGVLEAQLPEMLALLSVIPEEKTLHSYAPGKWTIRQVVNHVSDAERVFVARAFWFARDNPTALPSWESDHAVVVSGANDVSWPALVGELESVRRATITFFRNLPEEAWGRKGVASDYPFTVRSLAYIAAGHLDHHSAILRERYL